jgi:23S rRNA-/tRNA-specific pseudouridylate synthase
MKFDKNVYFQPQILALTDQWIAVAKPSGVLTIPGRTNDLDIPVLQEWVKKEYSEAWVTHRIDRETSGVVLFARTAEAHQKANTWFQQRKIKKIYHCLASGVPTAPLFKVNAPIEGALSVSQVEIRESYQEGFLGRVMPRTGRRHQIRIHLSRSGYPIWGDPTYGGSIELLLKNEPLKVERVALHASSLELPTGEKFEAPFPEDFSYWLEQLRLRGSRV